MFWLLLIILYLTHYIFSNRSFFRLSSPGLCLPVIGHAYKLMIGDGTKDQVNYIWNQYKKKNVNGILWLRSFRVDSVFIGDFETLKYVFNHPDVQAGFKRQVKMFKFTLIYLGKIE